MTIVGFRKGRDDAFDGRHSSRKKQNRQETHA